MQTQLHMMTPYACRMCGASSFRRVVMRDAAGAMTASGLYRCSVVFADPHDWRGAPEVESLPLPPDPRRESSLDVMRRAAEKAAQGGYLALGFRGLRTGST